MANSLPNANYRKEYTKEFVEHWDDLIGWEGRADAENGFFQRLLGTLDCHEVIDVAAGTGFHAVELAKQGFKVTATDGAENMVRQTQANAETAGVRLEEVRQVEWLQLATVFGENRFDGLVCLGNAFTHLFDHEARRNALTAMFKVLKPGGVAVIDHRNYDAILDQGFKSTHRYYYTGDEVDARPVEISRTAVKFEYSFADGNKYNLTLYPLRQDYLTFLFHDAGFVNVMRYGDFVKPYETYDPDFIQQVAYKPYGNGNGTGGNHD